MLILDDGHCIKLNIKIKINKWTEYKRSDNPQSNSLCYKNIPFILTM